MKDDPDVHVAEQEMADGTDRDGPLVLVIEDNERARSLRSDALSDVGCQVIPVDSADTALMVLRDGPSVDLIVTDIHLGGPSDDRGGVDLAQIVKTSYDAELPIAAYSGHYFASDLSDEEQALFVEKQTRGNLTIKQKRQFALACKQHGLRHREARLARSGQHSLELQSSQNVKEFVFSDELSEAEQVIAAIGYELRLLSSSAFSQLATTVPVWVRPIEDGTEAQVCGQPMLHWEDINEEAALHGLVEIMAGFAEDFRNIRLEPIGPAKRLRDFLDPVVVGGARQEAEGGD